MTGNNKWRSAEGAFLPYFFTFLNRATDATTRGEYEGSCIGLCDVAIVIMLRCIVKGLAGKIGKTVDGTFGKALEEGYVFVGTILMASLTSYVATLS